MLMNMIALTAGAEDAAAASSEAASGLGIAGIGQFVMIGLMVVVFYFLLIRPQKKREKEAQQMRSQIEVGDEITTIGGIIGTVVIAKDEYLVIETGSDRSKMRLARWAIQNNNTKTEAIEREAAARKEAAAAAKKK